MPQDASDNLSRALTGDIVVFDPVLEADWDVDGYGADDSYDNLTEQADNIAISHSLFDGLPDEIAYLSGTGIPTLSAALGGRDVGGVELTATQYWSPDNSRSPLYGKVRDIAPTRASLKVITDGGPEQIRMFTGLVLDTPTPANAAARLEALSLTRLLLSQAIQPPPMDLAGRPEKQVVGDDTVWLRAPEPNLSWLVSWVLHRCGVYPSPPRVPGCVAWVPLHGAGRSFVHAREYDSDLELVTTYGTPAGIRTQYYDAPTDNSNGFLSFPLANESEPYDRRFWVPGPYILGARAFFDTTLERARQVAVSVNLSTARNSTPETIPSAIDAGRIEFYIRGDEADVDGQAGSYLNLSTGGSGYASAAFGILSRVVAWFGTDRKLRVWFFPTGYAGTRVDLTSTGTLPEDGLWHFVGVAWSKADNKLWLNLDGTVESTTSASVGTATDTTDTVLLMSFLPISEFQLSVGDQSNPDDNPTWLRDDWWTRRAYVHPTALPVFGSAESQPREAMEYLASCAMHEIASLTIDPDDILHYRPRAWDATDTAQAISETITTKRHARTPNVSSGSSRIRNVIRVTYNPLRRLGTSSASLTTPPLLEVTSVLELPPGVSTYEFTLDRPAVDVQMTTSFEIGPLTASEIADLESGTTVIGSLFSSMAVSTTDAGTDVVEDDVSAEIVEISPTVMVIQFTNDTGRLLFLATDASTPEGTRVPFLRISGFTSVEQLSTSVVEIDDTSLAERGPRVLNVHLPELQTAAAGQQIAQRLKQLAAQPTRVITGVEVFGDPRRLPGDLVQFEDEDQTGVSGAFRIHQVENRVSAGQHSQTLRLVEAQRVGTWGDGVSRWGQCLWRARESPGIYGE